MSYNTEWLHQTDFRLPRKFNRFGCFVRAIVQGAEDCFETHFTVDGLKKLVDRGKAEDAINENMFLQNSDSHRHVLSIAIDELGYWRDGYRATYKRSSSLDYKNDEEDPSVYWFYVDEYDVINAGSHFVRAHTTGGIRWNPMPDLKLGDKKSRRVFGIRRPT